jgi:hypothetical protein
MLILLLTIAIVGSFAIEMILHEVEKHYEIAWVSLRRASQPDLATDVVARLRAAQGNLNAR